jgi:hypothetical protein
MKRLGTGVFFVVLFLVAMSLTAYGKTTNYGNLTLSPGYLATNFADVWDLTKGDLSLSYTIDMSHITQTAAWETSYTEVGLRQVGAANFNPGPFNVYQGGAGGWLTSLVGDLTPSPGHQSLMDKHNLSASGGRGDADYDMAAGHIYRGPSGGTTNYGIWFDRDSVDQWQADYWGSVDGGTYNTGGVYNVVITYHALSDTLGDMFVTINGIPTGFFTDGVWKNAEPDFYPAGLSFTGDMSQMQVFAGLWSPATAGGDVFLSDITATGTPVPLPGAVWLFGSGLAGLGFFRRRLASLAKS